MSSSGLDPRFATRALRWLDNPFIGAFLSPRRLDDYLELLDPTFTVRTSRARITAIRRETPDCVTLVLRAGLGFDGFEAGQHLALSVELDGRLTTRVFSIASPSGARDLELTIKRTPSGTVSPWANLAARVGDVVTLGPATGDFVLPPREGGTDDASLLFIAGGSGVTPIRSLVETAATRGHRGPIGVLLYAQGTADAIYLDRLRALARAHANLAFRFVPTRARPEDDRSGPRGRFRPEHVDALGAGFTDALVYACGPESLLNAATGYATARGLAIRTERFHLPTRPSSGTTRSIRFLASDRITTGDDATPILARADDAGIALESGCRRGICHRCVCPLVRGSVRNLVTGEVDSEPGHRIRLCISAAMTDVEIDG